MNGRVIPRNGNVFNFVQQLWKISKIMKRDVISAVHMHSTLNPESVLIKHYIIIKMQLCRVNISYDLT